MIETHTHTYIDKYYTFMLRSFMVSHTKRLAVVDSSVVERISEPWNGDVYDSTRVPSCHDTVQKSYGQKHLQLKK
jgi:hypothetical protein